jgi:pilus assembly protein CpaE
MNEATEQSVGHPPTALVFISDQDSAGVVRQSLNDIGLTNAQIEFVPGDVRVAADAMGHRASPRLLIVEISDVDDPIARLNELARVCEPGTSLVVIGDTNDIKLYRQLRNAGVTEYYFKPLVRNLIAQTCNQILTGNTEKSAAHTGRLVFVLGVRGGVGATTVAVSTAWNLAEIHKRWALLVDLDVYGGDAALDLDSMPSHALAEALADPERVDELFLDRGAIHITPRLDLLASLEPLGEDVELKEEAVLSLLEILLHRYRFVVVDLPAAVASRLPRVLHLPSLCVLVSTGSLVAARDVSRWRKQIGPNTPDRSTIHILNQNETPDSVPHSEFARVTGVEPDVVIPHYREVQAASKLGIKGLQSCAGFHRALEPMIRELTGDVRKSRSSLLARLFG